MNTLESLNYAQGRLAVARAMCDHPEIEKWREHVEYWQSKLAAEEADRSNEVVCKTCNGIKYIPGTKSTPDKQCPECKGRGLTQRAPDVMPCGHPLVFAYQGEDGGTYCRVCESA